MACVLAGDLGGSGLRLALVDPEGRTLARESVPMAARADAPGAAEADPEAWWAAFVRAAGALAAAAPDAFAGVAAVAVAGMTRSQVLLDGSGAVLRPAILWADTRAAATLDTLRARLPETHPETRHVNAFHPLARLWWLAQAEPWAMQRLASVLEPKDYLNFRLTGAQASDPVSMARLVASAGLLAACGLDRPGLLPRTLDPADPMGRVRKGLDGALGQLAGVPVLAMANDTWASAIGLGAMRPGYAYNLTGTSEVLGVVGTTQREAEGLMTIDWTGGLSQLGGPSQAGGDTLAWLLSVLGRGEAAGVGAELDRLAGGPRTEAPLLFLPYLQGERTPYWDAGLRGAFVGLDRRHGAADMVHAVMQGVAFLNRVVLERAAAATGLAVGELRFGGGGAASAAWCQIKADVLGCAVVVPAGEEHGLLGAAIVAWTSLGRYPDLLAAQDRLVLPARRYLPDPARRAQLDGLFALFRAAEEALRPISHRLAGWEGGR